MNKQFLQVCRNTFLIILIIILYFIINTQIGNIITQEKFPLNKDWTITINGEVKQVGPLKDSFFPVTNIGDRVELSSKLPNSLITRPVLQLKIYHSMVTVFVDGKQIYYYSYGNSLYQQNRMVGSGFFWIPLPEDYSGKDVKICFDVTEDNAFSSIDEIFIMEEKNVVRTLILENITEVLIGIFLFAFGVLLSLIVLFIGKFGKEYRILFWIAIFSTTVAIWMMSNFCILELVCKNLNTISYFEYLSLYFAPIPMLLFVHDSQNNKKTQYSVRFLLVILAVFIMASIYLNECTIYHFPKVLPLFHIIGLCTIALTTFSNMINLKRQNKKSDRIILYGLGIMVIFLFADILRFNIDKYLHPKHINISSSILPIGVLIFVFTMLASYIYRLVQFFYTTAEKQTLVHIAYTDALTNVGNRAMCEKVFHERDLEKKPATVINFDLNHFKEVNDTLGHSMGDEVLVQFAKLLQDTYGKNGFVGRMGGDEFIVVLKTNDEVYVEKTIGDFITRIDIFNKKAGRPYQISAACGYCSNKWDLECSLWQLYERSDQEMYLNKDGRR